LRRAITSAVSGKRWHLEVKKYKTFFKFLLTLIRIRAINIAFHTTEMQSKPSTRSFAMLKIRGLGTVMKYILSAALSLTLLFAINGNAASISTMSQLEYLQWLVQLSGDSSSLPRSPKASDYVNWATQQGVVPAGGWRTSGTLTRDVLASTLVQFLNIKVKAGSDAYRALQREGIVLPGYSGSSRISRLDWIKLIDNDGLQDIATVSCIVKPQTGCHPPPWSHGNPPPWHGHHWGWGWGWGWGWWGWGWGWGWSWNFGNGGNNGNNNGHNNFGGHWRR
jgi:hypothetical protein